eukprot:TRINITY_DN24803_c0_g1_i1.p1 TRINITY_DN24803_c0_g1~~TRINITY_DN24803_c0_g1_i1.p1  ORF type:complete len:515 (+),score=104.72 TRINITY_DN24803_c0_g1_i1:81-1625(+)
MRPPLVPALRGVASLADALEEGFSEDFLRHICETDDLQSVTRLEVQADSATQDVQNIGVYLPSLRQLRLAESSILSVRDLGTSLLQLEVLWMSRCGLQDLSGVLGLPLLRELYIPFNDVADLVPLGHHEHLEVLDVEGNAINGFEEVSVLQTLPKLHELTLSGNPMCRGPDFSREAVLNLLPSLEVLDDSSTSRAAPGSAGVDADAPCTSAMGQAWGLDDDPLRGRVDGGDSELGDVLAGHLPCGVEDSIAPLNPSHPLLAQGLLENPLTATPKLSDPYVSEPDELELVVERLKRAQPKLHQHAFTARPALGGSSSSSLAVNLPDRRLTRTADIGSLASMDAEMRPGTAAGTLRIDDHFQNSVETASNLTCGERSLAGNPLMAVRQRRVLESSSGSVSAREGMDIRELIRRYQTFTQPSCLPPEELRNRKLVADSKRPCTPDVRIRAGDGGTGSVRASTAIGMSRVGTSSGRRTTSALEDSTGIEGTLPRPNLRTDVAETLILEEPRAAPEMLE